METILRKLDKRNFIPEEISKCSGRSVSSPDLHGRFGFGYMRCLEATNIQKQAHKKQQMENRRKNGRKMDI